jgi:hypothetical protein
VDLPDVIPGGRDVACGLAQVDRDIADLLRGLESNFAEGRHIAMISVAVMARFLMGDSDEYPPTR